MAVVVVGAGHAGVQVAASLRQLKYEDAITLIGSESSLPYQRPPLSKEYLRGEQDFDRIVQRPAVFYEKNKIALRTGQEVMGIDRKRRQVELKNGESIAYDQLVLATGSIPIKLPIKGADLQAVHMFRNLGDVQAILKDLKSSKMIGIIGGGYVGLEAAASLRHLGFDVALVEMAERLLSRVATEELSSFTRKLHEQHNVSLHLSSRVVELRGEGGRVQTLVLANGELLHVDTVIVGIGVEPASELGSSADLATSDGIRVDEHCKTNDPSIYAVGDCTNHPNPLLNRRLRLESVPNALEQARVAAANIVGKSVTYASHPWFWSDQYDVKLQLVGLSDERDTTTRRAARLPNGFVDFHTKRGVLIGADAVNAPREFMAARQLCGSKVNLAALSDNKVDLRSLICK